MVTPQLLPDAILPLSSSTPVGPGTSRPIYLSADQVAAWVFGYKTWRVDVVGTIDGLPIASQGNTLQNNNLSNPTAQNKLVIPGSIGMTGSVPLGLNGVTIRMNTGSMVYDSLRDVYWPNIRLDFNSGMSSFGGSSAGTTAGRIDGKSLLFFNGSISPNTVVEITPNSTW